MCFLSTTFPNAPPPPPPPYFLTGPLSSIYFSSITVFNDISKQILQQRTRMGKIFALWHLAIAITSAKSNKDILQGSFPDATKRLMKRRVSGEPFNSFRYVALSCICG